MDGGPEDLKWFRKHLEEDKETRLQNVSDRLPISTSNRYFRMMAEIEKVDQKEHTTGQKKRQEIGKCEKS